ncbi:MAG TPA: hypothetical protein DEF43_04545 [Chloroflexus aurantiacus]|nr:MAG: hypothetical protein D6716_12375 [Chloroflexota bacterium]HBW66428.1 hypothetical protein [Chloroflexus aurantiacus]
MPQDTSVCHHGVHPGAVGDPWGDGRMNRIASASRRGWYRAVMPGRAQAARVPDEKRRWYL